MTQYAPLNATNVSNYVTLDNRTIDVLTNSTYNIDIGVFGIILAFCALLAVCYYTRNFAGYIGVGVGLIAYSFTLPTLTGVGAVDFIFFVLMGLSIMFTGIFTHKKSAKGDQ